MPEPTAGPEASADELHQQVISLLRVEAGMQQKALATLTDLQGDLVGKLANTTGLSVNKVAKLNALLAQTNATIDLAYKQLSAEQVADLKDLAKVQGKAARNVVNAGIGASVASVAISPKTLEAVANAKIIRGASAAEWWAGQSVALQDKFARQMQMGIMQGESVDELVRRVMGTKANGYKDGIMEVSKRDATALVRTSVISVTNEAKLASYREMGDLVKGIQWLATLDTRTTPICRALDKKVWRLPDMEPVGHDKAFPGATAHWNCRSTQLPVMRTWEELSGKKLPTLDKQELDDAVRKKLAAAGWEQDRVDKALVNARASMNGELDADTDWQEWLSNKSDGFVEKLLGPKRAELFKARKLTISDLTDQNNRPLTIAQLEEALDAGDIPVETTGAPFLPMLTTPAPFAKPILDALNRAATKEMAMMEEDSPLAKQVAAVKAAEPELEAKDVLAKAQTAQAIAEAAKSKAIKLGMLKSKMVKAELAGPGYILTNKDSELLATLTDEELKAWWASVNDAVAVEQNKAAQKAAGEALEAFKAKSPVHAAAASSATGKTNTEKLASAQQQLDDLAAEELTKLVQSGSVLDKAVAKGALKDKGMTWDTLTEVKATIAEKKAQAVATQALNQYKKKLATDPDYEPTPAQASALEALPDDAKAAWYTDLDAQSLNHALTTIAPKAAKGEKLTEKELGVIQLLTQGSTDKYLKAVQDMKPAPAPTAAYVPAPENAFDIAKASFTNGTPMPADVKAWWDSLPKQATDKLLDNFAASKGVDVEELLATAPVMPAPAAAAAQLPKVAPLTAAKTIQPASIARRDDAFTRKPDGFPADPAALKVVRKLGGTTGAELVKDDDGKLYVRKSGASAAHVTEEHMADVIYDAFGVAVPRGALYANGAKVTKLTEYIEGKTYDKLTGAEKARADEQLKAGFAVDALLGNWDVGGASGDNLLLGNDGKLYRIDNGGSLRFRAMGTPKDASQWNAKPMEIFTMRTQAPTVAGTFAELDIFAISRQMERLDPGVLDALPLPADLDDVLKARLGEMRHVGERGVRFQRDGFTVPSYERHAEMAITMRGAGLHNVLLGQTTRSGNILTDAATGQAWGSLRSKGYGGTTTASLNTVPGDTYAGTIETAIKSVNHKANNNLKVEVSTQSKVAAALALKPKLEALKTTGTADQQAMATAYLKALGRLEKTVDAAKAGNTTPVALPKFDAYEPPKPKTAPAPVNPLAGAKSVVDALHQHLAREHGVTGSALDLHRAWNQGQGGDSWSGNVLAMKYWMAKQRTDDPSAHYWNGNNYNKRDYAAAKKAYEAAANLAGGEANLDKAFAGHHVLMQEQLAKLDVDYNDRASKALLLMRTENEEALNGNGMTADPAKSGAYKLVKPGDVIGMTRGSTESHSIFRPVYVFGNNGVVTAVPHSRVLYAYWFEPKPGSGGSGFLGDGENEIAADSSGLPSLFTATTRASSHWIKASASLADWASQNVPVDHITNPVKHLSGKK